MKLILDKWQQDVLKTKGNIVLCSGRQVGKSTVISIKAGEYAVNHPKKTVLIIASVERQALLLFEKVLAYIYENHKKMLKRGKDKPTKHTLRLTNGSIIHCLPTGISGYGIRGYTIDQLYADEAHFIPEEVWAAVSPMLATTGGDIILLSTPHGRTGYFYRCFSDDSFTSFHVSSEDCPRIPKDFLALEKERMSKLQYSQEYLGEFIDELQQFFPDKLIQKCMNAEKRDRVIKDRRYFMGVDVARMGADESTFEVIDKVNKNNLVHVENFITRKTLTTMTTREILRLNRKYGLKKIYIDDGGMGVGVFDQLLEENDTRRKVVAINNASRSIEHQGFKQKARGKRLLKEDLYNNLLRLMERGEIHLLDDPEIFQSLKSIQYEYTDTGLRIFGNYSHIAEGLIRAAWCVKDKGLKLHIDYI
jgi:hypothetical protein